MRATMTLPRSVPPPPAPARLRKSAGCAGPCRAPCRRRAGGGDRSGAGAGRSDCSGAARPCQAGRPADGAVDDQGRDPRQPARHRLQGHGPGERARGDGPARRRRRAVRWRCSAAACPKSALGHWACRDARRRCLVGPDRRRAASEPARRTSWPAWLACRDGGFPACPGSRSAVACRRMSLRGWAASCPGSARCRPAGRRPRAGGDDGRHDGVAEPAAVAGGDGRHPRRARRSRLPAEGGPGRAKGMHGVRAGVERRPGHGHGHAEAHRPARCARRATRCTPCRPASRTRSLRRSPSR